MFTDTAPGTRDSLRIAGRQRRTATGPHIVLVVITDNDQGGTARTVAAAHAAHRQQHRGRRGHRAHGPILVGIDGPAGGGKSTLADRVSAALGDAPIVRMDDLYPGWDGLAASVPLLVRWVLAPAERGRTPRYRRYDWHRGAYVHWHTVRRHRYLIVEGAGSTCGAARGYFAVRVFVDADPDERMRRALLRDGDMFRPHWDRWARQEAALFARDRTWRAAHVTVVTDSVPDGRTGVVRPCRPPGA